MKNQTQLKTDFMKKYLMLLSLFSGLAIAQGATKTDTGINYNNVEIGYDTFVLNDYDYTWTGYVELTL
jgi:hypothetical protein